MKEEKDESGIAAILSLHDGKDDDVIHRERTQEGKEKVSRY